MPRRLVTIRQVAAVRPIPGADRIEAVAVDGWTCVAGRGEFREGDLAIFFEIGSFLPAEDPRWEHLQKKFTTMRTAESGTKRGFRVKSVKMRGQVSQGILEPLDAERFPEIAAARAELEAEYGGSPGEAEKHLLADMSFDVLLGVTKYENEPLPTQGAGNKKSENNNVYMPDFIPKTEQERVQNLPADTFERWADAIFQETVKMDGSSMTVYFVRNDSPYVDRLPPLLPLSSSDEGVGSGGNRVGQQQQQPNGRVGVCSRNLEKPENQGGYFWATARQNDLPRKLSALNRNVAVQGELCGSSIQRNFEGFPLGYHQFFAFAVWDIDAQRYMKPREAEVLIKGEGGQGQGQGQGQGLGLEHAPVVGYSRLGDIAASAQELLLRAEGVGVNGRKREGIVLKHVDGGFSFKAISNSYLLKHGE